MKKNPSDCLERDRNTVGREDNPQQDKHHAVSRFKIQRNPIRGVGGRRSDVSGSPPVGERAHQRHRFSEEPSAGIQICENRPIKKFSTGAAARSENSESFPGSWSKQSELAPKLQLMSS